MKGKSVWMAAAIMFLTVVAHATQLTVTDVKVAQRYPWNGLVDITYAVNCDDATKDVWVYPVGYDADNDKTVAMMPAHLTGDGVGKAVKSGTHRMTWDMATAMGKDYNRAAFSVKMHAFCDAAPYMVIDLSSGSESERYEVSYLAEEPEGGWGEEYLTTKMVFRLILPGRSSGNTSVENPYYFALRPITCRQYALINGGSSTSTISQFYVSYKNLRGGIMGIKWPTHQQVDADSIVGKMRLRTGMTVDIPTYAQWYRAISADCSHTSIVSPNAWGVYSCSISGYKQGEWCRSSSLGIYYVAGFYPKSGSSAVEYNYLGYTSYVHKSSPSGAGYVGSSFTPSTERSDVSARLVVCPVSK